MDGAGFWLAQGVGAVAAVLGVVAFQMRRIPAMLALLGLSALVWALHFALLGAAAAAAINLVTAARNFCGIRLRSARLAGLFAAVYVAAALAAWRDAWDLLPLFAVLAGTLAVFRLEGLRARAGFLAGSLAWVVYNVQAGSLPGVAMMLADAGSNLRTIARLARAPGPP